MEELQGDAHERNIRILTQWLMDRYQAYSQQEQARRRDRSRDARRKRTDVDERLKSLAYLKDATREKSIVDEPPGSLPGSSSDGAQRPPRVKTELEHEVGRMEDLMDEMYRIKGERAE
jgi:hypothetical protein